MKIDSFPFAIVSRRIEFSFSREKNAMQRACNVLEEDKTFSALSLDLSLREYRGSVSSMLFGTFRLDFRQGDLSFCDGCVSASGTRSNLNLDLKKI